MATKKVATVRTRTKLRIDSAVKPRVAVGELFTENDVTQVPESAYEQHTKGHTTIILVVAVVVFYGVYIAHEWYVGNSLTLIGQFLQSAIIAFAFWCIGKGSFNTRASP